MIESGQWNYTVIFVDRMERPAHSRRQSRFLPALKMFEYSLNIYFLKEFISAWTLILWTVGLLKALYASAKNCLGSWTINALLGLRVSHFVTTRKRRQRSSLIRVALSIMTLTSVSKSRVTDAYSVNLNHI